MSKERIGFIGLGRMGRPMAVNLAAGKERVQVYDVRPEAMAGLEADCLLLGDSIREIAESSSLIFMMVFSSNQVKELVLGPNGLAQHALPETLLVDLTSSDPAITCDLGFTLREKNIHLIDAPVSGGVEAAIKATLTFMTGGEEVHVKRVRPFLEKMGKEILHMGPLGAGHAMKLMNNFISATTMAATAEVVALARKTGIPAVSVVEALQTSTGTSDAATRKFPKHIFPNKEIGFPIELMHKDMKTYLQFTENMGIHTSLSKSVFQIWDMNVAEGRGSMDAIHFVDLYEQWCGMIIRGLTKLENGLDGLPPSGKKINYDR